jgi:diguanylate cyclase (GGDEF)-like protein
MDPLTVITLLALNLIAVGGLLQLISHRMPEPAGLRAFAVGAMVFGCSYLLRLALGYGSTAQWGVLADVGMFCAALCFATGVSQFTGRAAFGRHRIAIAAAAYLALALVAITLWGDVGRHAVLNLALAGVYLLMAVLAQAASWREAQPLRAPLRILAVTTTMLGLATGARGVVALWVGLPPLFAGPWAQAYYSLSILVTMLLGPNLLWMVFVRLNSRLNELATHDALTAALNRRGLEEAVQRHFGQRPPAPLRLLLVDVDHFKRVNDQHGHAVGDAVLRSLARTLAAELRAGDLVARWGGEEFLVVCPQSDAEHALALAERLRAAVQGTAHGMAAGAAVHCTVSIGLSAAFNSAAGWEAALRAADEALYAAKNAGRNRVALAGSTAPEVRAAPG